MTAKSLFTLLAIVVLTGCAGSKPASESYYYILDTLPPQLHATAFSTGKPKQVKVSPVLLPDYLNQPNLVMKLSNHQIKIANYHFWADDLRQSIQQVLINDLNVNHPSTSYSKACSKCDELVVTIDHFYPTQSGEVVLVGSYYLTNDYKTKRFMLKRELKLGGYDETVSAMRSLLSELADKI